jgi:DNA topoisomerase-1
MTKKYSQTKSKKYLVIVESPAKCKKIEEYLGSLYTCVASFGHLRELASLKNIDVNNHFTPSYTLIDNDLKKKQIEKIRAEIKKVDEVILATDDDREGEAIAWHLCQIFSLPVEKTKRIVFHEITEQALQQAVLHPRTINMNIVHAQQARQILDLLVGFHISPLLWKAIARNKEHSLSAGRCQTPALRLVYDNYKEIEKNPGQMVYDVVGYFTNKNIAFDLNKEIEKEEEVTAFLEEVVNIEHRLQIHPVTKTKKAPPQPFSTSRLQQAASNELHYSPKETMSLCQKLYEAGYITYMRTDSTQYSRDFVEEVKKYILTNHLTLLGEKNIRENIDSLTTETMEDNGKKGTEKKALAHEAIRPTAISLRILPDHCGPKEKRLYALIWETTLESCMADATYFSLTAIVETWKQWQFRCTSEQIDFPGWKVVKKEKEKEKEKENKTYEYLYTLLNHSNNKPVAYKKIIAQQKLKHTKQHYTEARLVQILEEKGIGRPSTFSMLIEKIQEREYVKKQDVQGKEIVCKEYELEDDVLTEKHTKKTMGNEKGKLVIQPLGVLVMEFLQQYFSPLFDYEYTKRMEDHLDLIANQEKVWYELCDECLQQIETLVEKTDGLKKKEIQLDEHHIFKIGRYGPVIEERGLESEKPVYLSVKKDIHIDMDRLERGDYALEEIVDTKTNQREKPQALGQWEGQDVFIKKGKFGLYATWGEKTQNLKSLGNRPMENIKWEEVSELLQNSSESGVVREITPSISIRKSKRGDYIFYKTSKMKKPLFYKLDGYQGDYKTDSVYSMKQWIQETHHIQ